jgi:hypothetical protein
MLIYEDKKDDSGGEMSNISVPVAKVSKAPKCVHLLKDKKVW